MFAARSHLIKVFFNSTRTQLQVKQLDTNIFNKSKILKVIRASTPGGNEKNCSRKTEEEEKEEQKRTLARVLVRRHYKVLGME